MAIFNGRYRWDGTKQDDLEPVAWYPGAYDVKILDRSGREGKVQHLKPFICLYARTGEGQSISANPEKFAKRICSDFSLDIDRVLWVEDLLTENERYDIILFTRTGKMGKGFFYRAEKRRALEAEVKMIEHALNDLVEESQLLKGK
ncbi:MAG: hypothetical protein KJ630_23385 [Proteobacteria bacterium]|nr:hypothetical protein [Pseudomonadota bacterium]